MSIPIRLDYKLKDGSVRMNQGGFTISYGTEITLEVLRENARELIMAIADGLGVEDPKPWYVRDAWLLDAVEFRETGTEDWAKL